MIRMQDTSAGKLKYRLTGPDANRIPLANEICIIGGISKKKQKGKNK